MQKDTFYVYDGSRFEDVLSAVAYLAKKVEEFCSDIYFVRFRYDTTIDHIKADFETDVIESFTCASKFERFIALYKVSPVIYIKTDRAAKELTKLCGDKIERARGSKFAVGLNFYIKDENKFLPEAKSTEYISGPAAKAIDQMKDWLANNA